MGFQTVTITDGRGLEYSRSFSDEITVSMEHQGEFLLVVVADYYSGKRMKDFEGHEQSGEPRQLWSALTWHGDMRVEWFKDEPNA